MITEAFQVPRDAVVTASRGTVMVSLANDLTEFRSADDALTLLYHLGYLAFDAATSQVKVPNEEVRRELATAVQNSGNPELVNRMRESRDLLASLISMNDESVAKGMAVVHERECIPLFYNSEHTLRSVVKMALVASVDSYARFEELAAGHGYIDIFYIPKAGSRCLCSSWSSSGTSPQRVSSDRLRKRDTATE